MKKHLFLGIVAIFSCTILSAQTAIKDVVPNYFRNFYRINTYSGKVLDKSLSGSGNSNVYEASFHGGTNQEWLIMPLYLNSPEAIIVNRHGKVLDRSSGGNLYCNNFHGGLNQIFKFDRKADGKVIIECDNLKVGDISQSSLNKDPFAYPSQRRGNLYAGNRNEGSNQKFTFQTTSALPHSSSLVSWRLYENPGDVQLNNPPAPASLNDNTLTETTTPRVQIGQTYLPCFHVYEYGRDFNWKINTSPYYIVKQYTYYKLVLNHRMPATVGVSNTWARKFGIGESIAIQVSNTIGMTHKSDGGVADVSNTEVSQTFTTGLVVTKTTTHSYEDTKTTITSNFSGLEVRFFMWVRMVTYELWRMNESYPMFEWTISTDQQESLAYPPDMVTIELKSSGSNTASYEIVRNTKTDHLSDEHSANENLISQIQPMDVNNIDIHASEIRSLSTQHLSPIIDVFPNPAKSSVTVLVAESLITQLRLIDLNGRILKEIASDQHRVDFDCSDIANGLYNLQIVTGGNSFVRKIIIQK